MNRDSGDIWAVSPACGASINSTALVMVLYAVTDQSKKYIFRIMYDIVPILVAHQLTVSLL
jgi:hypothetical protein